MENWMVKGEEKRPGPCVVHQECVYLLLESELGVNCEHRVHFAEHY